MMLWNILLTVLISAFGWAFSKMFSEVKRLQILLNKTREEYLPRDDAQSQTTQILEQLRRLEEKLDRFIERQNG
jgi:type II secretory pathway predicted ATPase ExeA|tara:strand:- start:255 stop:476 length:222 start_codon:yes stop_codon:yes gene_type:complete